MIGILGGTFDPVHFGHLRMALELYQDLPFTEIRFVPCLLPPHREAPEATPGQRMTMLKAAIDGQEGFCIDDRELRRAGPSYMVDTLASLRGEHQETPLALILGMDAFIGLPLWHRWQELVTLAHIVVVNRPGAVPVLEGELAELYERCQTDNPALLGQSPAGRIMIHAGTLLDISATRIRALIASQESPRYLLPDAVWEYICKEEIYSSENL